MDRDDRAGCGRGRRPKPGSRPGPGACTSPCALRCHAGRRHRHVLVLAFMLTVVVPVTLIISVLSWRRDRHCPC